MALAAQLKAVPFETIYEMLLITFQLLFELNGRQANENVMQCGTPVMLQIGVSL